MSFYTPIALKLHAFGLKRLHDPNWTGAELYDDVKRPVRLGYLLQKIEKEGFLFWLGGKLFDDYMTDEQYASVLDGEYLVWFLEDYVSFLACHGADSKEMKSLGAILSEIGNLYDQNDEAYFRIIESYRRREQMLDRLQGLIKAPQGLIESVAPRYAASYADRVFHDRELCGYISELLVTIGFDGTVDVNDFEPKKWVERTAIPQWAKKAVYARDRGKCAQCGADILMELEGDDHIDHMVALSKAGCNDLVNLQLLCKACNLKKSTSDVPVTSSIPPYLLRFHT